MAAELPQRFSVVVFDLGGVLIDWNPRHLYRKLFAADEAGMEDAGRSFAEAIALAKDANPGMAPLIEAYFARWDEMLAGPIAGSVELLEELGSAGMPLYALTNWSAETFAHAQRRFAFLDRFRGIVVSGEVGLIKPDRRIFELLCTRYAIAPQTAVYIDDNPRNARAAEDFGMRGIHFTQPGALRRDLAELGLVAATASPTR